MKDVSRRFLLGASGSLAAALALRARPAFAMDDIPKRVVLFFTPHGTIWDSWRPSGTQTSFTLSPILAPLEPFKSRLAIIDGVGFPTGGPGAPHTRGPAVLFTGSGLADDGTFARNDCSGGCTFGWNTYHSVDQEVARRLSGQTPYDSLELGVLTGGGKPGSHISYSAPAKPLLAQLDPYLVWQRLFAGLQSGMSAQDAVERARRVDVLSTVRADLAQLEPKVAATDWKRLQAHADAIAELQRALQASARQCTLPSDPGSRSPQDPAFRPWAFDRQSELLAAALACDFTRVASLQFRLGENDSGAQGIYGWLGQVADHHPMSHEYDADSLTKLVQIRTWYAQRFSYLLQQLDRYPEADGTMLDHTLVVWGTEVGRPQDHSIANVPFVVAGGTKRGVRGGQYLRVAPATKNNRLLVSICHYMGFTDLQKFGLLDAGSGPLPGLLGA